MADSWATDELRALLDLSQDIVIAVDESGNITFINAAVRDVLGYDPDAMLGTNAFEYIHPEDRDAVFDRFIQLIEEPGASTDRVQHRMERKDGRDVWVESIGNNQTDSKLESYVITTRNIADLKAYEVDLEHQVERLEEFASVVSHDLRNPLNVAQGRLELVAEECDSDNLPAVKRALGRMETLIDDILALSRAGELVGELEVVELPEAANASWTNVPTESAELAIVTDHSILADETRLNQLLENLFRNAVEHGGRSVTITVGDLQSGFYIADDGPGIPEDDLDRVFEAGYSTTAEGTGFGLNIVRQITHAHDWDISVTESGDGGTRFEIVEVDVQ